MSLVQDHSEGYHQGLRDAMTCPAEELEAGQAVTGAGMWENCDRNALPRGTVTDHIGHEQPGLEVKSGYATCSVPNLPSPRTGVGKELHLDSISERCRGSGGIPWLPLCNSFQCCSF